MATFVVTTLTDELNAGATVATPGGAGLSLREAIELANASAGADTIEFATALSGGTIRPALGTLQITDALTINGDIGNDGSPNITISGDVLDDDTTLAGTDITILASTAGTELDDNVRIIKSTANISLDGSILTGGIVNGNALFGGAVYASGGNVQLSNSIVAGNGTLGTGASGGGGIFADNITVENSSITGNVASFSGGGLTAISSISILNSTITGNSAGFSAGGVLSLGNLDLTNSIFLGNTAGLFNPEFDLNPAATPTLSGGNIVGSNLFKDGVDVGDTTVSAVFASVSGGAGDLTVDANDIPTIALKLDATNPALDASNATAPTLDAAGHARFDQPGVPNINGSAADLGAAEAAEFPSLVVTTNLDIVNAFDGKTSLREAIAFANIHVNGATPDQITFDASVFTGGAAGRGLQLRHHLRSCRHGLCQPHSRAWCRRARHADSLRQQGREHVRSRARRCAVRARRQSRQVCFRLHHDG